MNRLWLPEKRMPGWPGKASATHSGLAAAADWSAAINPVSASRHWLTLSSEPLVTFASAVSQRIRLSVMGGGSAEEEDEGSGMARCG